MSSYPNLNREEKSKNYFLIIISLLYLCKIILYPKTVQLGGSEIHYFAYFYDYLNFFKNFEYTGLQTERWHYQEFRWGMYVFPIILSFIIKSHEIIFFINSPILIYTSFCIFIIILKKYLNIYSLLFFIFFWIIHPDITKFTYSFSTNAASILVISVILLMISRFDYLKEKYNSKKFLIILLLLFFLLYGIRETNIIFFPFIIYFLVKNFDYKHIYFSIIFGLILYFLETLFIGLITNWEYKFGRLLLHFIGDTSWIEFMKNDSLRFGEGYSIKNFSRSFLDGGIFSRWYFTGLTINFFYIFSLIYAIKLTSSSQLKKNKIFYQNISFLYLSYFFTLSFALAGINPPTPFIHFNIGIQSIGLPLAIIIFLIFLDEVCLEIKSNLKLIFIYSFVFVLLSLKSFNHLYKVDFKDIRLNQYNLISIKGHINKFKEQFNSSDCINVKGSFIHLQYLFKDGTLDQTKVEKLDRFIDLDPKKYIEYTTNNKFNKINFVSDCRNIFKFYKFKIIK